MHICNSKLNYGLSTKTQTYMSSAIQIESVIYKKPTYSYKSNVESEHCNMHNAHRVGRLLCFYVVFFFILKLLRYVFSYAELCDVLSFRTYYKNLNWYAQLVPDTYICSIILIFSLNFGRLKNQFDQTGNLTPIFNLRVSDDSLSNGE